MIIDKHSVHLVMEMTRVILFLSCKTWTCVGCKGYIWRKLTAEVVHAVVPRVFLVQKLTDFSDGVSVESRTSAGREGHGNHSV